MYEEQDQYLQDRSKAMEQVESTIVELGDMFVQLAGMVKGNDSMARLVRKLCLFSARRNHHENRLERRGVGDEHRVCAYRAPEVLPFRNIEPLANGQGLRHYDHFLHRFRYFLCLKFQQAVIQFILIKIIQI